MAGPGRNDPCPCGSGKKFKHCCLTRPQAATGITPRDRTEAFDALLKYSRREQFDSLVAASAREWADMPDASAGEALAFIIEFPTSAETFFDWLFFDVRTDGGRTIADAFLGARQWTVSPAAAEYMRLMRESHLRLYQVRDVRPGAGLTLRDLWTKDDLFITERLGSTQLVRWDVLAARVHAHLDGTHQCEGSIMALPPHAAKPLLRQLRAEHKAFTKWHPETPLADFFKQSAPLMHDAWLDEVALREPPALVTSDGDPLTTSVLVFDVPKAGEALVRLLEQPDFEPGELAVALWFDRTGDKRRLLGDVECRHGHADAHHTLERTRRARPGPTGGAARSLELRRQEHRDFDPADMNSGDHALLDSIDVGEVPELQSWLEERDREWLDLSVPALDGRTPREAAQDRRLRGRLRALLMDIENREARMTARQTGRDLTWMWKELGLRRP